MLSLMLPPVKPLTLSLILFTSAFAQEIGSVGDWPDWRGPDRDGVSREKGLPEKWSLRSEEHTSELQSRLHLVCRLLLEKKKKKKPHTRANDVQHHHGELRRDSIAIH